MGKSYYCDYCDKSFKSDPVILKKHLNGMQHQIARKAYYAQFKCMDSEFLFNIIKQIIIPVSTIGYCNNFCLIFFYFQCQKIFYAMSFIRSRASSLNPANADTVHFVDLAIIRGLNQKQSASKVNQIFSSNLATLGVNKTFLLIFSGTGRPS